MTMFIITKPSKPKWYLLKNFNLMILTNYILCYSVIVINSYNPNSLDVMFYLLNNNTQSHNIFTEFKL